jgi:hypothetical protein
MAAVNNASFLAHLEKLQDESAREHNELSSGNMTGSFLAKHCESLFLGYVLWSLLVLLIHSAKCEETNSFPISA